MSLRDLLAAARDRLDQGEAVDAPEAPEPAAAPAAPARPANPPTVHKQPEHHQHIGGARLPAPGTTVDVTAPAPAPAAPAMGGGQWWAQGVPAPAPVKRSDDPDTHVIGPHGRPMPGYWENRYRTPVPNCQHPELMAIENRTTRELVGKLCDSCGTRLAADWTPPSVPTPAAAGTCQHPKLQPVRIKTGELVAYWCPECETQFDTAYTEPGYHDLDHQDQDGTGADEDEASEQSRTRAVIDRLTKGGRGGQPIPRPANARPARDRGPDSGPAPRAALVDRFRSINPRHKSLAYHAVAFGVGWYFGIPQWVTAETGYLAQHCESWTDSMALTGYVPAAVVFYLDRKSRRSSSWLAFPVRVVSVSLVIGVLLYSGPATF